MKSYSSYKSSDVEWIGAIPRKWKEVKLKYFGTVTLGKMLTPTDKGGFHLKPYLRSFNVQIEKVNVTSVKEMWFSERELEKYRLKKGDLLFNEGGDVGRTCMWNNELDECYIQNSVNMVRLDKCKERFILYQSTLHHHVGFYDSRVDRVSIPHLTKEKLESIPFVYPSIEEQDKIIEYLDEHTQKIDQLIELTEQKIEFLKEQRIALINQCVTKGLNPNVEMKDSGVEWIGEIPTHWKEVKLKYFSSVTLGKMLTNADKGGFHYRRYLRSKNIQIEKVDVSDVKKMWFSDRELEKYRLKRGDLLFNEGGDVGRACIWNNELDECYIQNSVNRVQFSGCNEQFVLYQSTVHHYVGFYDSRVDRVSIPHLTKEKLESIPFVLPTLNEQTEIVKHLDEKTQIIDSTIGKESQRLELLKEYRQALISEVVTGKIDVRGCDG